METLKRDYSEFQNIDLRNITSDIRGLEWNLGMTISDFTIACRQYWKDYNFGVAEGLRKSSGYMDCICSDLENMKKAFHEGGICFSLFKELCGNWKELKKSILRTQHLVNQWQERRKNFHWLGENHQKRKQMRDMP
jgi:hypothetical protein